MHFQQTNEALCAIYVDMGTTNTRGWLMRGSQIVARADQPAGVRDTARDGSPRRIHTALRELAQALQAQTDGGSNSSAPSCIAAAGMIGSPLGLAEVPHVAAPAGLAELAMLSRWFQFPDVSDLPVMLVPGVRSGTANATLDAIGNQDVMRGEETLCVGLAALGLARPPCIVLNLGSHWKAIHLSAEGRIESSVTSLSGELIHAAQTQTILASAVPKARPCIISEEWKSAGMREQRRSGLARAMFCVRLLELARDGSPDDRLSFLIGAFIASDLDALLASGALARDVPIVIVGPAALAEAWRGALAGMSMNATVLPSTQSEEALLAGLRCILGEARRRGVTQVERRAQP